MASSGKAKDARERELNVRWHVGIGSLVLFLFLPEAAVHLPWGAAVYDSRSRTYSAQMASRAGLLIVQHGFSIRLQSGQTPAATVHSIVSCMAAHFFFWPCSSGSELALVPFLMLTYSMLFSDGRWHSLTELS